MRLGGRSAAVSDCSESTAIRERETADERSAWLAAHYASYRGGRPEPCARFVRSPVQRIGKVLHSGSVPLRQQTRAAEHFLGPTRIACNEIHTKVHTGRSDFDLDVVHAERAAFHVPRSLHLAELAAERQLQPFGGEPRLCLDKNCRAAELSSCGAAFVYLAGAARAFHNIGSNPNNAVLP